MRCPKCNNDNPDDAVYCPGCYAVLLKPESAAAEPAQTAELSGPKPSPARPRAALVQSPPIPWRQVAVVVGIASATLLLVAGALWLFGGHEPAGAVPTVNAPQGALNQAFSEARAAGGEKVALERVALLTAASVVQKNVPSQTLGAYAGWVLKKAQAVLADSGRDCRVSVQVTLHPDAAPSFEVVVGEGQPEAVLLQRLRKELQGLDPLHTSAQDVSFGAYFTVKSGVPAAAAPQTAKPSGLKPDAQAFRKACGVEIGMFCNAEQDQPKKLAACLRQHSRDLLAPCRQSLGVPAE